MVGNTKFKVHSELVINFPVPGFARLPVCLNVHKFVFEGCGWGFNLRIRIRDDRLDVNAGVCCY